MNGSPQDEWNFCKGERKNRCERRLSEFFVVKFLHPLVLVLFTQHISAIIDKLVNLKRFNFASKVLGNLPLQENCTMTQATASSITGIVCTERCHVLFTRVMESLLCSARAFCNPVRKLLGSIAVLRKFISQSRVKTRRMNTDLSSLTSRSTGVAYLCCCIFSLLPLWYWFQDLIRIYISRSTYRSTKKYVKSTVLMKVNVNLYMKSIRICHLHQLCSFKNQIFKRRGE